MVERLAPHFINFRHDKSTIVANLFHSPISYSEVREGQSPRVTFSIGSDQV